MNIRTNQYTLSESITINALYLSRYEINKEKSLKAIRSISILDKFLSPYKIQLYKELLESKTIDLALHESRKVFTSTNSGMNKIILSGFINLLSQQTLEDEIIFEKLILSKSLGYNLDAYKEFLKKEANLSIEKENLSVGIGMALCVILISTSDGDVRTDEIALTVILDVFKDYVSDSDLSDAVRIYSEESAAFMVNYIENSLSNLEESIKLKLIKALINIIMIDHLIQEEEIEMLEFITSLIGLHGISVREMIPKIHYSNNPLELNTFKKYKAKITKQGKSLDVVVEAVSIVEAKKLIEAQYPGWRISLSPTLVK